MSTDRIGPTLRPGEDPWPLQWESDQRIDDGHAHLWELVTLPPTDWRAGQNVVRCQRCSAPRCGHSTDPDPCIERRHHLGLHIYESGCFEPLGGFLRREPDQ